MMQAFLSPHQMFVVGGFVRDAERAALRGEVDAAKAHDVDFLVVGPSSLDEMRADLAAAGFHEFDHKAETLTSRCKVPAHLESLRALSTDADFVLAREESSASDGRFPDEVKVGNLTTDLARRDFTVNALAREVTADGLGDLVDHHDGMADLAANRLRFVGDPMLRLREDGVRLLRALRFHVVKGFDLAPETREALFSPEASEFLLRTKADGSRVTSVDAVREEVEAMCKRHTLDFLALMAEAPTHLRAAVFTDGLRLCPTTSLKAKT